MLESLCLIKAEKWNKVNMLLIFLVDSEWDSITSALKDTMEIQNDLEGNGQF